MKRLVYLIGIPGAGKTQCLDLAFAVLEWKPWTAEEKPFAHEPLLSLDPGANPAYYLGKHRGEFSGTDALSMNVQPAVIDWLQAVAPDLVIGEGDRLGNAKFFSAAINAGYACAVLYLKVPAAVAAQRRAARDRHQNEVWIKGRITKVERLAAHWATATIDGTLPMPVVATQLAEHIKGCPL